MKHQQIFAALIVALMCLYMPTTEAQTCKKGPALDIACTLQYAPVCGCDCNTYGNDCAMSAAGVPSQLCPGECKDCQACQAGGWTRDS